MKKEFAGIIKDLEINHPLANNFRRRTLKYCDTHKNAQSLLRTLEFEEKEDDYPYRNALYAIFKSCAYDALEHKEAAFEAAKDALAGFRNCGNDFNEALAHLFLGLLYKAHEADHLALPEFDKANKLFTICRDLYNAESNFGKEAQCDLYVKKIMKTRESFEAKEISTILHPPIAKVLSSLWKRARLIFGVYDIGHASYVGKFVFEDTVLGAVEVEQVVIAGKTYNLHNYRGGTEIAITSGGDYRWLKVAGISMNKAKPIPIEPDDYVLADLKLAHQPRDIVIANLHNPPTPEERAGVIKRFTLKGLKSESISDIPNIPLSAVDICGVVIAIAKPA